MKYQSAFEILGPIMVGPSSSHTAGAVRIGNIAYQLLTEQPTHVTFTLMGSFAQTYEGHGTDLALLAGILGLSTDDERIPDAKEIAAKQNLTYTFEEKYLGTYHPNTVFIDCKSDSNSVKLVASSIGGGKVEVQEIDEYPIKFGADKPTLVINHKDKQGFIANLACLLQKNEYNIARLALERSYKDGPALTICEVDSNINDDFISFLKKEIPIVERVRFVQTN